MAMQLARWIRRLGLVAVALAVVMAMPAYAQGPQSAEQQLAAKYSPLLSLDPQSKPCGSGEGVGYGRRRRAGLPAANQAKRKRVNAYA
jgi:hypothetical protein